MVTSKNIYRFTVSVALFTLVLVGLSLLTGYKGKALIALLFVMPLLWTLWIACVVFDQERRLWLPTLLWGFIDLVVYLDTSLLVASVPGGGTDGGDMLFAIAFSPLILPAILLAIVFPMVGTGVLAITQGASSVLMPHGHIGALADWLAFSIISALSSYLFVCLFHCWKVWGAKAP